MKCITIMTCRITESLVKMHQFAFEKKGSNAETHLAYPPINTKSTGNNLGHNLLSSTAISKRPSSAMPTMKETTPQ